MIDKLNEEEIKAECREAFNQRERDKEEEWDRKGRKYPKNWALWEVYWKNNKFKKGPSHGGVNNLYYSSKVINAHLIPFFKEIML
jgi:hypothetical protein